MTIFKHPLSPRYLSESSFCGYLRLSSLSGSILEPASLIKLSALSLHTNHTFLRCHIIDCVCPSSARRLLLSTGSERQGSLESWEMDWVDRVSFVYIHLLLTYLNERVQTRIVTLYFLRGMYVLFDYGTHSDEIIHHRYIHVLRRSSSLLSFCSVIARAVSATIAVSQPPF